MAKNLVPSYWILYQQNTYWNGANGANLKYQICKMLNKYYTCMWVCRCRDRNSPRSCKAKLFPVDLHFFKVENLVPEWMGVRASNNYCHFSIIYDQNRKWMICFLQSHLTKSTPSNPDKVTLYKFPPCKVSSSQSHPCRTLFLSYYHQFWDMVYISPEDFTVYHDNKDLARRI